MFNIRDYVDNFEKLRFMLEASPKVQYGPLSVRVNEVQRKAIFRVSQKRYMLEDNYKVTLIPLEDEYCDEVFYLTDLNFLVRQGYVEVYEEE